MTLPEKRVKYLEHPRTTWFPMVHSTSTMSMRSGDSFQFSQAAKVEEKEDGRAAKATRDGVTAQFPRAMGNKYNKRCLHTR